MAAGKNFKVSITFNAIDKASAGIKNVARSIRGFAAAAAGPLGQLGAALGAIGRVASAIITPIVNAGKALFNFGVRIVTSVINKVRTLIKWLLLLGAAVAEEFVRRSINAFADYEQAIVNAASVTGLMGDALTDATQDLFDFGLELSRTSSKRPTEIAEAFYALSSAGLDVEETMRAARGVLALAEGTLADMGMTAELTTSTMRAFGFEATSMDRIVNVLAASIGTSRMNMERLSLSLPYVATSAQQLGISLEQTVAALGAIVNRGLEASTAGAQMRMMLAKLMSVTKEGQKVLRKYGLSLADVNVQQRGLIPVLSTLKKAGLGFADMQKLVGVRAASTATILKDNIAELVNMERALTGTNRAYDMQRQQMDTVQRAYAVLKSTLQEIQIRFAAALAPAVRRVTERLQEFVKGLLAAGAAQKVGDWLADMASRAMDFIETMVMTGKVQKIWDGLVKKVMMAYTFVKTLVPAMGKIIKATMVTIGEWLKYGADWVKYLWASFLKAFPEIAATVISVLAGIAKAFVWLVQIGDAVIRFFKILTNVVGIALTGALFVAIWGLRNLIGALMILPRLMAKIPIIGKQWQPMVDSIDEVSKSLGFLEDALGDEFVRRAGLLGQNLKDLGEAGGKFAPYHEKIKEMEAMGMGWAAGIDVAGVTVPPRPPGISGAPAITINIPGGMIAPQDLPDEIAKVVIDSLRQAGYAY